MARVGIAQTRKLGNDEKVLPRTEGAGISPTQTGVYRHPTLDPIHPGYQLPSSSSVPVRAPHSPLAPSPTLKLSSRVWHSGSRSLFPEFL